MHRGGRCIPFSPQSRGHFSATAALGPRSSLSGCCLAPTSCEPTRAQVPAAGSLVGRCSPGQSWALLPCGLHLGGTKESAVLAAPPGAATAGAPGRTRCIGHQPQSQVPQVPCIPCSPTLGECARPLRSLEQGHPFPCPRSKCTRGNARLLGGFSLHFSLAPGIIASWRLGPLQRGDTRPRAAWRSPWGGRSQPCPLVPEVDRPCQGGYEAGMRNPGWTGSLVTGNLIPRKAGKRFQQSYSSRASARAH